MYRDDDLTCLYYTTCIFSRSICNFSVIGIKKNLSESFIRDGSSSHYPDVEISTQQKFLTTSLKLGKKSQDSLGYIKKTANNVTFDGEKKSILHKTPRVLTDTDSEVSNVKQTKFIVGVVEANEEKEGEIEEEPIITSSIDMNMSVRIPNNFESLYKKTHSCDDREPVTTSIDNDGVKGTRDVKETSGEVADAFEHIETTGLGLNVSHAEISDSDYTGSSSGLEFDRVDDGVEHDEKTDTTEEATVSRGNLSLNFDEDNVELLKLEKGLIALCVGKLFYCSKWVVLLVYACTCTAEKVSIYIRGCTELVYPCL